MAEYHTAHLTDADVVTITTGIYYIPFKTGCSLVFSYSGQSIPNRLDVKKDKGVKIYFDAVETAARVEQVKLKVRCWRRPGDSLSYSMKFMS